MFDSDSHLLSLALLSSPEIQNSLVVVAVDVGNGGDAALRASSSEALQKHRDVVAEAGRSYGLDVNMAKPVILSV